MSSFTGTGRLIRLALRRDRTKLPLWILGISGLFAASVASTLDLYANDAASRLTYAMTTAPSIVSRVFGGPINGPDIGSIILNETFLFTALAVAFMSTLTVIRHTRQNEETGRAELVGSAVVGRYASLTAALGVAVGANIMVGTFTALILLGNDLPSGGSVATGLAIAGIGSVFAAFAALTAQISESARGANSLAALTIGAAFILRAIGDSLGTLTQHGMGISSAWPTWLSPIGWVQQLHPFTEQHWSIFGLLGVAIVIVIGLAFVLTNHRDIGLGMLPVRQGPTAAPKNLLSAFGLAWRLQKGVLRGWAITIVILGATYGLVVKEFEKLFTENEAVADLLRQLGGGDSITDVLLGALMAYMALTIGAYAVQALQRMRSEEAGGQLEPILATATSRPRWMLSHISCGVIGIATLTFLSGISMGLTYVLAANQPIKEVATLTAASFAYMPAILVLAGFAILSFGLLPRVAIALAWTGFGFCMLIAQFGSILKLPQWILNVSPFTHSPSLPAESLSVIPVIALLSAALLFGLAGIVSFRQRDVTTA